METKVMLVDDDDLIRDSVDAFFKSEDIEILTAASGEECLRHLEGGFRGVILMDVMMPEMSGWDTIRRIVDNNLYQGNIIVMLTALNSPDNKMEGLQEYVTDYITKPFNPNELMDILQYYTSLLNSADPVYG